MLEHNLIDLTVDIVSAHLSNNTVSVADVPSLIQTVYQALASTSKPVEPEAVKPEPAVSIRSSIKPDYIVCLEDGAKLKMLKRYLRTRFNMSPEQYRAKWDLPKDYPMVAPSYAEKRKELAVSIGLGKKPSSETVEKTKPTKGVDALKKARARVSKAEPASSEIVDA